MSKATMIVGTLVALAATSAQVQSSADAEGSAGTCPCTDPIEVLPHYQDFEAESPCGTDCGIACLLNRDWINVNDGTDDFDWTTDAGGTLSANTGPSQDANPGNVTGFYAYTETSGLACQNGTAVLLSPCLDASEPSYMSFAYHMNGADIGALHVDVTTDDCRTWTNELSIVGPQQANQSDPWSYGQVDLSAYAGATPLRVRFRGETGGGFEGDMAIDDIAVIPERPAETCSCSDSVDVPHYQDFEAEPQCETSCGAACVLAQNWINVHDGTDDFDWTTDAGGTPSATTGPSQDVNPGTSAGRYAYTETGGASCQNGTAVLLSPCLDTSWLTHMSFAYHMYGADMGALHVDVTTDDCRTWTNELSIVGSQQADKNDPWSYGTVDLSAYADATSLRVRFRGETGGGADGSMAIDDVAVFALPCPCTDPIDALPHYQDFEAESECAASCGASCVLTQGWINVQDGTDDFDWNTHSGGTASENTGPAQDANRGVSAGLYAYTESSGGSCQNGTAVLLSPCFDASVLSSMSFAYHMYGADIGALHVDVTTDDCQTWTNELSIVGPQQTDENDPWSYGLVDLTAYEDAGHFRVRFRGETGGGFESDMAIDDIAVIPCTPDLDADGSCAEFDCADDDPDVYPGAPEINDGLEQQCPGDPGFGLIDEISGTARVGPGAAAPFDPHKFHWPAQVGANLYRVARSDQPDFTGDCVLVTTPDTYWVDSEDPPSGGVFYYMARTLGPTAGPWDVDTTTQRSLTCADERHTLVFHDEPGDDVDPEIVRDLFMEISAAPSDYIHFQVRLPYFGEPFWEAERCMERADWYVAAYLDTWDAGNILFSGAWQKWARYTQSGDEWTGPHIGSFANQYGFTCFGPSSWCVEQGMGGFDTLAVDPDDGGFCESVFTNQGGCGNGIWQLTITIAGDRQSACGF